MERTNVSSPFFQLGSTEYSRFYRELRCHCILQNADVLARPNLKVTVKDTTERWLFTREDGGSPTTAGVLISQSRNGPKFVVGAKREVILSAGIVGSPQILQLSGVGPANDLKTLQIPVVHDLPSVGQNLIDVSTVPM